jgi:hypothetical protein
MYTEHKTSSLHESIPCLQKVYPDDIWTVAKRIVELEVCEYTPPLPHKSSWPGVYLSTGATLLFTNNLFTIFWSPNVVSTKDTVMRV